MPQISVIIPVYKVEKYLETCIESILAQSYKDFELILIDDGSSDSCGSICDIYAIRDKRVKVVHQENQGLSSARNAGMDVATGEYITFIDSDDMINRFFLESLLHYSMKESADVTTCLSMEFENPGEIPLGYGLSERNAICNCYDNLEACIKLYNGDQDILVNAWGKLFRAELISDLRFPVKRLHEDQGFIPIACYRAGKVATVNQTMYYYRIRSASITKEKFSIKRYDDLWALDRCITFFEERGEKSILEAARAKKKRLLAVYSIYAKRDNVSIPKKYKMRITEALIYLRRNVSRQRYQYYLSQISPGLAIVDEYFWKVEKIFQRMK